MISGLHRILRRYLIAIASSRFCRPVRLLVTVWFHWVTYGQGLSGAEKSLLWAAILLFFVIRGGNRHSVDAPIRKAF